MSSATLIEKDNESHTCRSCICWSEILSPHQAITRDMVLPRTVLHSVGCAPVSIQSPHALNSKSSQASKTFRVPAGSPGIRFRAPRAPRNPSSLGCLVSTAGNRSWGHSKHCPILLSMSRYRRPENSSTVSPASLIIALRVPLANSLCLGTVSLLCGASLCRRIMWLPVWWSISYPIFASAFTTSMPETTGSLGTYFNHLFFYGWWNRLVVLLQACHVAFDGIFDIG